MAKAFDWLSGKEYAAVQRALRSIWFGEPAPCAEAAQAMGVDQERLEQQLATFANLIAQALPIMPDEIAKFHLWHHQRLTRNLLSELQGKLNRLHLLEYEQQRYRERIAEVQAKIDSYQQPLYDAENQLKKVQGRLGSLKAQTRRLEAEERTLRARAHMLEETVSAIAAGLDEVSFATPSNA